MSEYDEDFDNISVSEVGQRDDGWTFVVELGHGDGIIEYMVVLDRNYWTRLTGQRIEPSVFVETVFKFLLERGSKETIKRNINISDISGSFPNFEMEIKRLL